MKYNIKTLALTFLVSSFLIGCDSATKQLIEELDTTAPTLVLNGDPEITIAQGSTYTEPNVTSDDGTISIQGSVDTSTIGTYTVIYTAVDDAGNSASPITITVHVTDQTPPTLVLTGPTEVTIAQGSTYQEQGATSDDGTISIVGTVDTATIGTYELTYNAVDDAENSAAPIKRTVHVTDQTASVITLLGEPIVKIVLGETYTDAGANLDDENIEGTSFLETADVVNTSQVGTYTLRYKSVDSAGNVADEVMREVQVRPYDLYDFYSYFNNSETVYEADKSVFTENNELQFTDFDFSGSNFIVNSDNFLDTDAEFYLHDGEWLPFAEPPYNYELTSDGYVFFNGGLVYAFSSIEELANTTINPIDDDDSGNQVGIEVLMPEGAQRVLATVSRVGDFYQIEDRATYYVAGVGSQNFHSLSEVIQLRCGHNTFNDRQFENGDIKGIAFTCGQENQMSGTLIGKNDDDSLVENVGTWEIANLPNSNIQAILITTNRSFWNEEIIYEELFAMKDGEVWDGVATGDLSNVSILSSYLYNKVAFDAVEQKLAEIHNGN